MTPLGSLLQTTFRRTARRHHPHPIPSASVPYGQLRSRGAKTRGWTLHAGWGREHALRRLKRGRRRRGSWHAHLAARAECLRAIRCLTRVVPHLQAGDLACCESLAGTAIAYFLRDTILQFETGSEAESICLHEDEDPPWTLATSTTRATSWASGILPRLIVSTLD